VSPSRKAGDPQVSPSRKAGDPQVSPSRKAGDPQVSPSRALNFINPRRTFFSQMNYEKIKRAIDPNKNTRDLRKDLDGSKFPPSFISPSFTP
jgi:hypothetical protein